MNRVIRFFAALLLPFALLFLSGCEKPAVNQPEQTIEKPTSTFPFFRDLTDNNGRTIRAEVLGRDTQTVTIVRWSDKKRFTLPLNTLSPADQTYLLQLPITRPRDPEAERDSNQRDSRRKKAPSAHELTGYAKILQTRIDDKLEEIEDIKQEMGELEQGTIRWKTLSNRRLKLQEEVADLRVEVSLNR